MIIHNDALEGLKSLDSDSIDAVITDPPYGYSFMGKDWDRAVPSPELWAECLRVLKPGAFCLVMSAPRSDVQMHMISNLTLAGFRLDFTPIYWTYASGFPKAGNIGKMVDKRLGVEREVIGTTKGVGGENLNKLSRPNGNDSEGAKSVGAYGQGAKQISVDIPITVPATDQALKNGKGISWLDDGRIPTGETIIVNRHEGYNSNSLVESTKGKWKGKQEVVQGRFPANLLVSDDVLNDGVERVSKYGKFTPGKQYMGHGDGDYNQAYIGDSGSYSRYFDLDKWASTLPFLIVPKASKSEKNKGTETLPKKHGRGDYRIYDQKNGSGGEWKPKPEGNHHPTVKPLKLMSYLITLFSREGDTILDPFVGSGTTCLAAKNLKRKYIGIEREQEYVEIAKARLDAEKQEALL